MTPGSAKHILIVEDSPDLQALLARLFKSEGYDVSCADNGQVALDFLKKTSDKPSLILLDIMMPVMDGIQFRKAQKQDPQLAQIPIVVMTADSNYRAEANQMDAADFVRKPIADVENLVQVVERASV